MKIYKAIGILSSCISTLIAAIHLNEWYQVSILRQSEGYPFGLEGPSPYYYASADLYSSTCLIWGVVFLTIAVCTIWATIKLKRTVIMTCSGITVLTVIAHVIQQNIG